MLFKVYFLLITHIWKCLQNVNRFVQASHVCVNEYGMNAYIKKDISGLGTIFYSNITPYKIIQTHWNNIQPNISNQ